MRCRLWVYVPFRLLPFPPSLLLFNYRGGWFDLVDNDADAFVFVYGGRCLESDERRNFAVQEFELGCGAGYGAAVGCVLVPFSSDRVFLLELKDLLTTLSFFLSLFYLRAFHRLFHGDPSCWATPHHTTQRSLVFVHSLCFRSFIFGYSSGF